MTYKQEIEHAPPIQNYHRELVATYFESTVPRWEEHYSSANEQSVYSTIYRSRLDVALSLADRLRLPMGARCLDIGCGPGIATVALAKRGFLVNAIDLVQGQLDRTEQRAAEAHVTERVATSVGDIYDLAFPEGVFDLVFVIGVMEWLEHPEKPLREIARVLRPGGHVILSVDNKWSLRNILDPISTPLLLPITRGVGKFLDQVGLRRKSNPWPRDYAYSIHRFDRLVANAGLKKAEGVTVGFGPFSFLGQELPQPWGLTLHRRLQRLANSNFPLLKSGGFVYVTVAEKG